MPELHRVEVHSQKEFQRQELHLDANAFSTHVDGHFAWEFRPAKLHSGEIDAELVTS